MKDNDDGGANERREKENNDACVASKKEGQVNLAFEERERIVECIKV